MSGTINPDNPIQQLRIQEINRVGEQICFVLKADYKELFFNKPKGVTYKIEYRWARVMITFVCKEYYKIPLTTLVKYFGWTSTIISRYKNNFDTFYEDPIFRKLFLESLKYLKINRSLLDLPYYE